MNKFWTGVIIVAVVAGAVWWLRGSNTDLSSLYPSFSASPMATVKATTPKSSKSPLPTSTLTYSQLVAQYGANRIQFDTNCQAQPNLVVFKNGTSILLDNRANQTRTIGLNGVQYSFVPYGYRVITLSSSSVPQKWTLSCNNLVNVGTIQLEANISGQ
jgi:hypothetical protein